MKKTFEKIKEAFLFICEKIKTAVDKRPFTCCAVMAVFMNVLIYVLHARSLIGGIAHIFSGLFGFFLLNTFIYLALYSLSLLFARRLFMMIFVTIWGLALGISNCVLMCMRFVPLTGIDFYIFFTGPAIVFAYMNVFEIILVSAAIIGGIALLVVGFIKLPKSKPNYKRASITVISCFLALLCVGLISMVSDKNHKENVSPERCGYTYYFLRSVFDRGIPEPENYSPDKIMDILNDLSENDVKIPARTPDIIIIQLESVFDVNRITDFEFSENPLPNLTALREKYPSGLFTVPSFGAGTANTEFEVLSGIKQSFFGVGEYPYLTVLDSGCCETIAYNLKELGYATHAFHNHTAVFYDRYKAYSHLGFDDFTAKEHMVDVEENIRGWSKDKILTKYIMSALEQTEERDFVFAVSVQGHGSYPSDPVEGEGIITVSGVNGKNRKNTFEYYVNQLREIDAFIGELYGALNERGEDFVLVVYGDHIPAIELKASELEDEDLYSTEYVVISNFDIDLEDRDIYAYELSPMVLNALNINNGLVNKVHAEFGGSKTFDDILQLVAYDMLYGERNAYTNGYPYQIADMKIGIYPITISNVEEKNGGFTVSGENFTKFSRVYVNGEEKNTKYIDKNTLFVEHIAISNGDRITVAQVSELYTKLSESEALIYSE